MPFDLDAVIAEEQATVEPFEFTFDGETYYLPGVVDVAAIAQFTRGEIDGAMRRLLGADQWQRIIDSTVTLSQRAVVALMSEYAERSGGAPLGELSASTGSSKNTGRPSKRTSNGSTRRVSGSSARRR